MKRALYIYIALLVLPFWVRAQSDSARLQWHTCSTDTSLHYWVLTPKGYAPGTAKKYPAILLFDPGGDPRGAMLYYASVADSEKILLFGSADYRNYNPKAVYKQTEILVQELRRVWPIDQHGLYVMGMSGGARFALDAAGWLPNIAGAIAHAAGFDTHGPPIGPTAYPILTVAGFKDYNYQELLLLDSALHARGFDTYFVAHDGWHGWAPPALLQQLWRMVQVHAMRKKTIRLEVGKARSWLNSWRARVDTLVARRLIYHAVEHYGVLLRCFTGVIRLRADSLRYDSLRQGALFRQQALQWQAYTQTELRFRKELSIAIRLLWQDDEQTLDTHWCSPLTDTIRAVAALPALDAQYLAARLERQIVVSCYEGVQSAWLQKRPIVAAKIAGAWAVMHPNRPMPYYLLAANHAREQNENQAYVHLQKAIAKGFTYKARILADGYFKQYIHKKRWQALLAHLS